MVYDDALPRVLLVAGSARHRAAVHAADAALGLEWVAGAYSAGCRSGVSPAWPTTAPARAGDARRLTIEVPYGDTWGGEPPVGILDHTQMAYDPSRQQAVLFGGQRDLNTFPEEVWTFDGDQWTSVAGAGPGSRVHHAMQYHPGLGGVVMFGGFEPGVSAQDRGDTWLWDGAWAEIAPGCAPAPTRGWPRTRIAPPSSWSAAVSRPTRRLCSAMPDGSRWVSPVHPRRGTSRASPTTGRAVCSSSSAVAILPATCSGDDTWELDATGWRRVDPR